MRTALVTGANRGIGLAIAAGLNQVTGTKVLLGSRRQEDGENAAKALGGHAVAVPLDLSTSETLRIHINNIVSAHGAIDILVNNAGVLEPGSLVEIDDEKLAYSLQVNFLAPLQLIRQLVPRDEYPRLRAYSERLFWLGVLRGRTLGSCSLLNQQSGTQRIDLVSGEGLAAKR